MYKCSIVTFAGNNEKAIKFIRNSVFTSEQGVAPEIDFDGNDEGAFHAVIAINDKKVGTGRMLADGHIGRIAILKEHRGKGLGAKIVLLLIDEAVKHNFSRVYLGSQKHALGFYEKLAFSPFGDEYIEAGIEHLSMERFLK